MTYRVDISAPALADIEAAYLWARQHSLEKAGDWYKGMLDAVFSLEKMPARCPLAPESREFIIEVRQLLYGKRHQRNQYRILFGLSYDAEKDEQVVTIYRVRHTAQRRLQGLELLGEVEESPEK